MSVGVGGGGWEGWVGGEGRPSSPRETGIGYGLEGRGVYDEVDPATLGVWGMDVVMIVDDEGRWRGIDGDGAVCGVGGVGGDDVEEGGRRVVRSLPFRLETGRSPKSRMHLTEGQNREILQKMFKW